MYRRSRRTPKIRLDLKSSLHLPWYTRLGLIGLFMLLVYVWQRLEVVRLNQEFNKLHKEIERWENSNRYLLIKIESATAPQVIETYAREKLGMIYPSVQAVKVLTGE